MSTQHQDALGTQTSIFNQLIAQLEESSRRFSRLELDALEIEKLILLDVHKQKELYKDSNQSAEGIIRSLSNFDEELNQMKHSVRNLSLSFKELIKKESVGEIESKIDHWPLEQFITREKFSSLLEEKTE